MAKMGTGSGLREIPLSQIVETGNVRFDYTDINELAESIKLHGQLNPVQVKAYEPDENGIERFEIVSGHRRRLAIKMLNESGESFTTIKAVVVNGDKLTLQLVENLQREDLTAAEREKGIYQMCQNGLSQKEVAARLSKTEAYISRNISAYKIREAAQAAGVDTFNLATATLNEIQAANPDDFPFLINEILNNGGTSEAARNIMQNYRVAHGKPANPQREKVNGGLRDPLHLHPSPMLDPIIEELSEKDIDTDVDVRMDYEKQERNEENKQNKSSYSWLDSFEPPPHKQVDFNDVCIVIMKYAKETNEPAKCEAAGDIIALLHSEV